MQLSIIIPVLNEASALPDLLAHLMPLRATGAEVIVVDGGSTDGSQQIASHTGVQVICTGRGRAQQMNAGASAALGDVLLFLHADTLLPPCAGQIIEAAVRRSAHEYAWGHFDVRIDGSLPMLRVVAGLMNWRSRLSGIATGDQALFVTRRAFEAVGGFPDQLLMEDIELSKRLLARSRPICLAERVATSGRRWEAYGVWRTILLMWRLRWFYWRGVPASELVKLYQ